MLVRMSVDIDAPPEKVWPSLIEPEKAMQWFTALKKFESYNERWEIEKTPSGSRFSFNDHIEFPYGPIGKVIGWFAARNARNTGAEILSNLKRLSEAAANTPENIS